jgi:hypothetical protein
VLGGLMLTLTVNAAGAHHSFAMFDRQRTLTMSGTVREFQWTNPHVWIQVIVQDTDGLEHEWSIESGARNMMARQGWTRQTLEAGDRIGLVIRPAVDGSLAGSLVSVTLVDGTVLGPGGTPPPRTGNAPPPK